MSATDTTKKPLTRRAKARRLEKILEIHAAWERRTLADLHVAGFKFATVDQAFRYLQAQRTLARLSFDELVEQMAQINETKARRDRELRTAQQQEKASA